jgi:hypothetical protein
VYTNQSGEGTPPPPALVGVLRNGGPWSSRVLEWQRARAGGGWAIYQAAINPSRAPVAYSLNWSGQRIDFLSLLPPEQLVRLFGVKQLLP